MGLRQEFGGKLEEALNAAVDKHLKGLGTDQIKAELHKVIDGLVDKHIAGVVDGLATKLKKDVIDLIDGEDDIK